MTKSSKCTLFFIAVSMSVVIAACVILGVTAPVLAETVEPVEQFSYTLIEGEDGTQSYAISARAAFKPEMVIVVIPDTYNGLPVTEISQNGFTACTNLKRVILPKSVKTIGNNAFRNCAALERISLPCVESIGMNAFAMCTALDRVFIPKTVKSVGANVLRNNSNTVYIQNNSEQIQADWQPTWNSYFTGQVVFDAQSQDMVQYRQILDGQGVGVIGYELTEMQDLCDGQSDIVIYNSFRPDEASEYLPVLNVCSEAFTWNIVNSITFKDRHTDDATAPVFDHKINIRSNAFLALEATEVKFEVGVTFEHPYELQNVDYSDYDNSQIVGDAYNKSVKVFAESTIASVTLPQDMDFIPEKMFYNCSALSEIKYFGQDEWTNTIQDTVERIGTEAFSSCVSLRELSIPSTVAEMGHAVFNEWGITGKSQTINIDFYDDCIPSGWSNNWSVGIYNNTVINYKQPTPVTIDLQGGKGGTIVIYVKLGFGMPEIEMPTRLGYNFNGIYSEKKGKGYQYYTSDAQAWILWQEGDATTLYADWDIINYDIIYPSELDGIPNPNPTQYNVESTIDFQTIEDSAYCYRFIPESIEQGTTGVIRMRYYKIIKDFDIRYEVDDYKGNLNSNPDMYNVTDEIVFENLVCEGYTFSWSPAGISKGSTGDITVKGTWTPNTYNIIYKVYDVTVVEPLTYTYGQTLNLNPVVRGGYFITWDTTVIPAGTIGDITVTAVNSQQKTLDACYYNGVYEIWTLSQFWDLRNQPNYCQGREYRLMAKLQIGQEHNSGKFTPLTEFRGVLDGNGMYVVNYMLDCTGGGNIGFCRINRGTIKNLTLGMGYSVDSSMSNVNVGSFAGINYGTISNCTFRFAAAGYKCYAGGTSYAGIIAGVNNGTIDGCYGGMRLYGSCNMGLVAGNNTGTISNCSIGHDNTEIRYDYEEGNNVCIGGIVGWQTSGTVNNCSYKGSIVWNNLNIYENRTVQPCGGIIIGRKQGGTVSDNTWDYMYGRTRVVLAAADYHEVKWQSGGKTYTHDQWLYYKEQECGRIG